ncbi:MAG: NADPH:quinone reductase, partial [Streptosporangiaceae bacterium]|nr:NADPH:quinone reductase [Streptosporangiaceae bacterium]
HARWRGRDDAMTGVPRRGCQAVVATRFGGPDVLACTEVVPARPGPGEVRVAVRAAGVNPVDCKIRRGDVHGRDVTFPHRLGVDVAGVVDEVGEGVTTFGPGDHVFGRAADGAYAEVVTCRAEELFPRPEALPWDVAGSLAICAETAYRTLDMVGFDRAGAPGRTVLIHAASGGVGLVATQLALARGARVIGTAGEAHLPLVRSFGGLATTYGPGWTGRVRALAQDRIDAVLDLAGNGVLQDSVELVGDPDAVVTIADPRAERFGVRYARGLLRRVPVPEVFADILPLVLAGAVRVPIAARFPLSGAADAHRFSEEGHPGGRIVLMVDEEQHHGGDEAALPGLGTRPSFP